MKIKCDLAVILKAGLDGIISLYGREITLPFVPMVGMNIEFGVDETAHYTQLFIEHVSWDIDLKKFWINFEDVICRRDAGDAEKWFLSNGWEEQ